MRRAIGVSEFDQLTLSPVKRSAVGRGTTTDQPSWDP